MKIRIHRLCALALISLLWWFAFAAQAGGQGQSFNPLSRLPKLRGQTGETHKANAADTAPGYDYKVLYSFCAAAKCTDGSGPYAGVIQDAAGNLYGTTTYGGANGDGAVFELQPPKAAGGSWTETVLYSFCSAANCTDGSGPNGGLLQDAAGNLYGATAYGGANDAANSGGGTLFKLAPPALEGGSWTETVLYSFCYAANCADGVRPNGGLIQDAAGNLYGTTYGGGDHGVGVVFELDNAGQETVLYSLGTNESVDGANPTGGVIQNAAGNLYGTTFQGGVHDSNLGDGLMFEVDATGQETVLYNFCLDYVGSGSCPDGESPNSGLILQQATGNLYGTTTYGGANYVASNYYQGGGTVFVFTSGGDEWPLYSFCSAANCTDGATPFAGPIQDAAGNLYGTTYQGGANNAAKGGEGTIFKLDTTGRETVLYSFCAAANCTDGSLPFAGLIEDADGNFYGTAGGGGANGSGAVFELALMQTPTVTVTPSASSITTAQALTVTVAVSGGSGNPTPTGTVTLTSGSYTSAATTLTNGGATINIPAGSLAIGTDILTVTYSGDSNYTAASGANSVTVGLPTPTVTVTPSASSLTTAQALTVTIAVSGGSGNPTPTGTVILTSGSYTSAATTLTGGGATINIPAGSLAIGTDILTVTYSGDSNYNPAVGTASVVFTSVGNPSYTVRGTAVSVSPGATTGNTSTITVTPSGGFAGNVTLTAAITSSPSGAQDIPTLSFGATSPVSVTGDSAVTATLTITTTAPTSAALGHPARPGVRWYSASGTGLAFGLVFGLGIIPARRRSWRAQLGMIVFFVVLIAGLLACGGGNRVTGNPGTTPGAYTVTVTGTSGSAVATSPIITITVL